MNDQSEPLSKQNRKINNRAKSLTTCAQIINSTLPGYFAIIERSTRSFNLDGSPRKVPATGYRLLVEKAGEIVLDYDSTNPGPGRDGNVFVERWIETQARRAFMADPIGYVAHKPEPVPAPAPIQPVDLLSTATFLPFGNSPLLISDPKPAPAPEPVGLQISAPMPAPTPSAWELLSNAVRALPVGQCIEVSNVPTRHFVRDVCKHLNEKAIGTFKQKAIGDGAYRVTREA